MSDAAQKKDEFKKHVRALLLSCPAALTVRELERDFYNFIGVRLAYRDIGYATIEDFLRDIDDAVQISYKNGVMTLTANADDTTKHIQRLVSRQKVSNKQKYAVYRNRGGGGPPRMYQGNNRYPRRSASNLAPPQPMVPAYVRRQIKDLFRSFPNGIPVTHLDSAFSRIYGTGINYRHYGFQNQYEFLQSLKDIIKVEEVERGEWRVFPVDNIGNRETRELPPRMQAKANNQLNMQTSQENYQPTQPVQHLPVQEQQRPQENNRRRRPSKGRGRRRENSGDSDIVVGQDARSVSSTSSHNEDHLEQEIQQVLEKNPGGIWANQFPKEFEAVHGRQLDYREHGYLSVIDFLSAMPDTVGTVRPNPRGDWMVYDARLPEPGQKETKKQRSPHNSGGHSTESEVKETIQTILNSRPYGVPVKKFPEVFKEYTGRNLPLSELGFDSSEDLCLAMEDSIIQLAYNGNEMIMYSIDMEMSVTDRESSPTPPPPGIPNSEDYPADAVGPGCHFVPLILPNPEQYVELYVTNVVNPGLFWVMLRHRTKSLALEYLMDQLDETYNKDRDMDIYRMPEDLMVPGQVCATLFPEDNNWHRGVITGSNDKGFIEIYYVDYGNTNFVQKNMIRFLKAEFLTLPAQAVQARLANTHPPSGVNGKWKNKSRSRLLELTCHRPLVAYICDVKSQKMSLCLTDTNQSDVDIHINDVMVNDGLAIFKPDAEVDAPADTNKHLMEPDYGHVFGWSTTEAPRLPRVAQNISRSESQDSTQNKQCYVKWIQVDESCVLHLINLDRQAYIVSAEISELFWDEDILTPMLRKKRMDIEKRLVCSDKFPDLFQELERYNVKSVRNGKATKQQFLSLYRLESLPKILEIFGHDSETLLPALHELIAKFDPDSPYWESSVTSEEKPVETVQDEDSADILLSLEEKQMALQALQIKRKRILQSMMSNPLSLQDEVVNQLNNCEVEIMMIKQELEEQKTTDSSTSAGKNSAQSTSESVQKAQQGTSLDLTDLEAENQRVIQNIIASSSKPIAAANIMTQPVTSTTPTKPVASPSQIEAQANINDILMSQSAAGFPGMLGAQSTTGSLPGMLGTQSTTGSLPGMLGTQSTTGSLPGMLGTQSATGSLPGMLGDQSAAGSLPGMIGAQNMLLLQQQQRMFNPLFMTQTGLPNTGMGDMANSFMANNLALGAGLNPNLQAGQIPQFNPLLFQQLQVSHANMAGVGNMNPLGTFPSLGRGQPINPSAAGLVPGMLPLLQHLSAGRAGRGSSQCNNQ